MHHIDGNHDNDDLDNLTVLCWNHHEQAQGDLSGGSPMTRRLSPADLRYYREQWVKSWERGLQSHWMVEGTIPRVETAKAAIKKARRQVNA